jgi:hypothetical protein
MGDIKEEVRNGRVVTKEIAEAAAKKVADDRQEKLTDEMVKSITNSEYKRKKQLLKLQKNRENEKISKEKLTKVTALDEELKAGSHTPESYRKANEAIEKEERDALRKVDEEFYELENQLESQYPNLYRW